MVFLVFCCNKSEDLVLGNKDWAMHCEDEGRARVGLAVLLLDLITDRRVCVITIAR